MRNSKLFLMGCSLMLLGASIFLFYGIPQIALAGGEICSPANCYTTDSALSEFALGTFYATGLRNQVDGEVQLLPIGLASNWVADPKNLPGKRAELAAVIYRDQIYAIGGVDETNNVHSEIFVASTLITGPLSASGWTTPTNLPSPRAGAAAVISTTQSGAYVYVIAGADNTFANTTTIFYRPLDAVGNFTGSWITTSIETGYLFVPGLYYPQAVVHNGFLYVIGGLDGDGSTVRNEIFRAPINSNGSLGTWVQDQSLPDPRYFHAAAIWPSGSVTDSLYVLGGVNAFSGSGQPQVYISSFSITDTLQPFTSSPFPLPDGSFAHGAVQANGQIFVTGGRTGVSANITGSVLSTLIDTNGELFQNWATSFPLPQGRFDHSTVVNSGGEVYVIGGYSGTGGGTATNTVYHGGTSGIGSFYAQRGTFTSRIIDLSILRSIKSLVTNTTLTNPNPITMTLWYRTGTLQSALVSAPFIGVGSPSAGTNISTTFNISGGNASLIQYRLLFTNTAPYNTTPSMSAIQITWPSFPLYLPLIRK